MVLVVERFERRRCLGAAPFRPRDHTRNEVLGLRGDRRYWCIAMFLLIPIGVITV